MVSSRLPIMVSVLVLLAPAIAIICYFAKTQSYTASDVFWYGAIAGFLFCLLLVSLVLIVFLAFKLRAR